MVETFVTVINVKKAYSLQIRFIKILCCCIKPTSGNLIIHNVKTSFTCCYRSSGSNPEQKCNEVEYVGDDVAKSRKDQWPVSQSSVVNFSMEPGGWHTTRSFLCDVRANNFCFSKVGRNGGLRLVERFIEKKQKWSKARWRGGAWTGLIWHRIETGGGLVLKR